MKKIITTIVFAVVFGLVAATTFVFAQAGLRRLLGGSEEETVIETEIDESLSADDALAQARLTLNGIDDQMVELFKQRMSVSKQIAEIKLANDIPVLNQGREDEVIARLTEGYDEENAEYITELYKKIFEISRGCQEKIIEEAE